MFLQREDPGSIPSTHVVAQTSVSLTLGDLAPFSDDCGHRAQAWFIYLHVGKTLNTHKTKLKKSKKQNQTRPGTCLPRRSYSTVAWLSSQGSVRAHSFASCDTVRNSQTMSLQQVLVCPSSCLLLPLVHTWS